MNLSEIIKTNELEPEVGQMIINKFGSYEDVAREWESKAKAIVITSRDQTTEMAMAREARRKFSDMRIELEKARKAIGEPAFRKYKAVNAITKYLQVLIQPIEDHLKLQEDYIKNDDARIEAEKKIEEERKIEAERFAKEKADQAEQIRIRKENERLHKEVQEREALIIKEREEAKQKQDAIEKKAADEKKALADAVSLEREQAALEKKRIEASQQAILDVERKERKRVQAELQAQKDAQEQIRQDAIRAENKRLEDIENAKKADLKKSDKEKYVSYIQMLLDVEYPEIKDVEYQTKILKMNTFFKREIL